MGFINSVVAILIATKHLLIPLTLTLILHFSSICLHLNSIINIAHYFLYTKVLEICISFIGAVLWFVEALVVFLTQNAKQVKFIDLIFIDYFIDPGYCFLISNLK